MWRLNAEVGRLAAIAVLLVGSGKLHAVTLQAAAWSAEPYAWSWKAPGAQSLRMDNTELQRLHTPLGSLWKLFVYSYLSANRFSEQAYRCDGKNKEEVYCCEPGQTIERNAALVKSCGLYFLPERWGITSSQWRTFWETALPNQGWLHDLANLQAGSDVAVVDLLNALKHLPAQAQARAVLLDNLVQQRARPVLALSGTQLRVKTFSWQTGSERVGGFAGWTHSGIPIWVRAGGTSASVFKQWPKEIAQWTTDVTQQAFFTLDGDNSCVDVAFFHRYPIQHLNQTGRLRGDVNISFANGSALSFDAGDGVLMENDKKIYGRFTLNEYVARVIDREGAGEPEAAARALAVVARTYVLQNADRGPTERGPTERGPTERGPTERGPTDRGPTCLRIEDSSARQRVSPRPPSNMALKAAHVTDGLVLDVPVQYHQSKQQNGQLSWQHAVEQARRQQNFEQILRHSYPQAQFQNSHTQSAECERLQHAEAFLQRWRLRWGAKLHTEPGYQNPGPVRVCRYPVSRPYADHQLNTIFMRQFVNANDQVTLAHEYCHLAFKYHPSTLNESYIEALARKLVMEP